MADVKPAADCAQIAKQRADAIVAYESRDYATAVRIFADYLNRSHAQGWDAEAVFDYGKSRMNTPSEGSRHVFEAIGMFDRYLQLGTTGDPRGDTRRVEELNEANHLLLKLYVQARCIRIRLRVSRANFWRLIPTTLSAGEFDSGLESRRQIAERWRRAEKDKHADSARPGMAD